MGGNSDSKYLVIVAFFFPSKSDVPSLFVAIFNSIAIFINHRSRRTGIFRPHINYLAVGEFCTQIGDRYVCSHAIYDSVGPMNTCIKEHNGPFSLRALYESALHSRSDCQPFFSNFPFTHPPISSHVMQSTTYPTRFPPPPPLNSSLRTHTQARTFL